jgi:hypothetical protein
MKVSYCTKYWWCARFIDTNAIYALIGVIVNRYSDDCRGCDFYRESSVFFTCWSSSGKKIIFNDAERSLLYFSAYVAVEVDNGSNCGALNQCTTSFIVVKRSYTNFIPKVGRSLFDSKLLRVRLRWWIEVHDAYAHKIHWDMAGRCLANFVVPCSRHGLGSCLGGSRSCRFWSHFRAHFTRASLNPLPNHDSTLFLR